MATSSEQEVPLKFRPRPQKVIKLSVPVDALVSIDEIAKHRDMSREALLRFYIGNGVRQDLVQMFSERVMETTAQVLSQHQISSDEAETILQEIRRALRPSFVK